MIKILNLNLMTMQEYENIKNFFANDYSPSWSEKVFVIKEVKNILLWIYFISDKCFSLQKKYAKSKLNRV